MRWHRLGHPAFLVAVATLALNDRVLKAAVPGWWTGKLSDVAGVVVMAWAASAVLERTPAVLATATGFAVLKVVPGGAELAAPVLGGETLRDPTDLLALVVLGPTWWLLGRPERRRRAVVAPVLGGLAAVLSVTATSSSEPSINAVAVDGDDLLAYRSDGYETSEWLRADGDGRAWALAVDPPGPPAPLTAGPIVACGPGGRTCLRTADLRSIERSTDAGDTWVVEFTEDRNRTDLTGSMATGDGDVALAAYGERGVLVRDDDGSWDQHAVGDIGQPADGPFRWLTGAWIAVLVVGVLFVGIFGLVVAILAGLGHGVRTWRRDGFDP